MNIKSKALSTCAWLFPVALAVSTTWAAPIVGPNVPIALVPGYQGSPQIAMDTDHPQHIVAAAISAEEASGKPTCDVQSPAGIHVRATVKVFGTSNGGQTWHERCVPWNTSASGIVSGADYFFITSPSVAYRNGTALVAYVQGSGNSTTGATGSAIVIAGSHDDGNTWQPVSVVVNNSAQAHYVYTDVKLAVDTSKVGKYSHPGRIYVTAVLGKNLPPFVDPWEGYTANSSVLDSDNHDTGHVGIFSSDDLGSSWTVAGFQEPPLSGYASPSIVVDADGRVYLAWTQLDPSSACVFTDRTFFSSSLDGGATWSAPSLTRTANYCSIYAGQPTKPDPPAQFYRRANTYVTLDVDRNPGSVYFNQLYMIYSDLAAGEPNTNNLDVFVQVSKTQGKSWSSAVRVNDDPKINALGRPLSVAHFLPTIAIDQADGSLNATWYDSRDFADATKYVAEYFDGVSIDLFQPDPKTRIYYARSVDGGKSFEPNVRVTDDGAPQIGLPWFVNSVSYSDEFTPHWMSPPLEPGNIMGHLYQYGDRMGLIAYDGQVRAVWTDTRDFVPANENFGFAEDIATAKITTCTNPQWTAQVQTIQVAGGVVLDWAGVASWGLGADSGVYQVFRSEGSPAAGTQSPYHLVGTTALNEFSDISAPQGPLCYVVKAINDCEGTALTAMTTSSAPRCLAN